MVETKRGMHIVFIASEAAPLAKTGGLADVAGSLPHALQALGHRVRVILPFYRRQIGASGIPVTATGEQVEVQINGGICRCPIRRAEAGGLEYILIEQDDMFDRDGLYGPAGGAYEDNLLRFMLFDRAALEVASRLGTDVDIIHCHDWQTALVPMLLKAQYPHYAGIADAKTVYTIHNLAYQGVFDSHWIRRLGIPAGGFHPEGFEYHGRINCMKAGIMMADRVTTVSHTYAREILSAEYGFGLDGFLWNHRHKLSGIENGLDTAAWDPATDPHIAARFKAGKAAGKRECKQALQQECKLDVKADAPLLAIVSRLAEQKGLDLLLAAAPGWLKSGCQLAVLGSGEPHTERQIKALAARHPGQCHFHCGFDEGLARRIYAGADIFLMPSRFEPCGLGQLIAMRYGTVPVVRATGGLRDTVHDVREHKNHSTGFHFAEPTAAAFDAAVREAVALYGQPQRWSRLVGRALRRDSSWLASAEAYALLYRQLIDGAA